MNAFLDNLDGFDASIWWIADGWGNGGVFNNTWDADQVSYVGGSMVVTLADIGGTINSGEVRTVDTPGHGRYQASLKASSAPGTIAGFFTYTGPGEGTRHDEIDIEILGDDPTQIQVNYWTDGIEHPTIIDLGFDASAEFHTYAFEWHADGIDWYVDGQKVHTENGDRGPLPETPGYLMFNLWGSVGATPWSSDFDSDNAPVSIYVDRVSFSPLATTAPTTPTIISGTPENDTLSSTSGNDAINGTDGIDTVVFNTPLTDHALTKTESGWTAVSLWEGTDTLANIERLRFADKKIALDLTPTGNAGQAMGLIGVLAPIYLTDPSIRGLMISLFDDGASMLELCELALDIGLLPADPTQLANTVFQNVTGQTATSEWTDLLTDYIDTYGAANFVETIADMAINAQLDVYSQTGLEYL